MDYAFAPGGTKFDQAVAKYLRLRPQTVLLKPATSNVAAFVAMVNTDATVQRPIGTLSIGCHGHPYGVLQIPLDSSSGKQSDINDVTRAETSHALEIALATLFPRPIDPTTLAPITQLFRIVGCSVAAARPFLVHLRKALGNQVFIVATQHEDAEVALTISTGGVAVDGVLRTLAYDFRVNTPFVLEGPADVVEAFDNQQLKFVDGKPIPRSFWKPRIPNDVFNQTKTSSGSNVEFNPKINGVKTLPLSLDSWEHIWESVGPWKVTLAATNPQTTIERREFMRGQLKDKPEFAAGHPFPLHQQRGFATYNAFIDGHDWINAPKSDDFWAGYRSVYKVGAAIKIPSDDDEIPYDWVDITNTATHFGLSESDSRLFVMIP